MNAVAKRWLPPSLLSAYVLLLVAVPIGAVLATALATGWSPIAEVLAHPAAGHAVWLTLWTSLLIGVVNLIFGTLTAWVLVRYQFPGRTLLSTLVDLPLALPTLVAGVLLAVLYGPQGLVGGWLEGSDTEVLFASPAILLALAFVTVPFVVRAVEPVLHEIDPAEIEAARVLGAGPLRTFRTVFLPAILPAATSGSVRSVGRALGEFGSVVIVSGNIPLKTLTAPVYVFGEIESGFPHAAAVVSSVLFLAAVLLHLLAAGMTRLWGTAS